MSRAGSTTPRPRGRSSWGEAGPNRTGRIVAVVASVLVFLATGFGWHSIDTVISGIERIGDLGLGGHDDGATDILMVGIDSRTDAHGNPLSAAERARLHAGDEVGTNTDTIVLIRIPDNGRSATAISIPRDSYVDVPGLGMAKINSAYGTVKETTRQRLATQGVSGGEAERRSTQAGRQALIKAVANLTGITVDHYAEVGLLGFALLTDAVGGVDVCLNNPVNEPMSGADFPAGPQRLDGAQALSFVRQRHELPRGDLDRIVRQQVYMATLVHQLLSAKVLADPARIQQLSQAVGRTIVLDDGWDVPQFLRQVQDLSGGKVTFETIPVQDLDSMTDNGESVVRVDPNTVRQYVARVIGDGPAQASPATVTVEVYNASGMSGLAGQVAQALAGKGFRTGTVDNWIGGPVSASRVLARSSSDPSAKVVAAALGGLPVIADGGPAQGAVRVVLAGDYSGPGSEAGNLFNLSGNSPTAIPVPPAAPLDAGQNGPKCVN